MITLDGVSARAGKFELRDVSFTIPRGAWAVLLGPAGSGKTTLLETIAGVRTAMRGRIGLRDVDVSGLPPERRRIGMVYQHAYLFPHLSVRKNIAYAADETCTLAVVRRLGIEQLIDRPVGALSGGERQLVALARALATEPDILLLDEPFAALDPRRRARVRSDLRRLQRERRMTVLQVTHDFVEAGLLGDLAIVLDGGVLQQVASPDVLFRTPASASVAEFIGIENVFHGTIVTAASSVGDDSASLCFTGEGIELFAVGRRTAGPGHAVIRSEDVTLAARDLPTSARNVLVGVVQEVAYDGVLARVTMRVGETSLVALVTRAAAEELALAEGHEVTASIKATNVHLC